MVGISCNARRMPQRDQLAAVFDERPQVVAWKTLPSWTMVDTRDLMIHPKAQRFIAQRAGARTIEEVDASRSVAVSRPAAVADLIEVAVAATMPAALNA